jgi:hypothetical protein
MSWTRLYMLFFTLYGSIKSQWLPSSSFPFYYSVLSCLMWDIESRARKQSHNTHMEERVYRFCSFKTSALDGGEWSASRPDRALPPTKAPRYPLYRSLGGPQSRSGDRGYSKIFFLCRGSNLDRSVVQSVARHYTDRATPAPETSRALLYDSEINIMSWSVQIPAPSTKQSYFPTEL